MSSLTSAPLHSHGHNDENESALGMWPSCVPSRLVSPTGTASRQSPAGPRTWARLTACWGMAATPQSHMNSNVASWDPRYGQMLLLSEQHALATCTIGANVAPVTTLP